MKIENGVLIIGSLVDQKKNIFLKKTSSIMSCLEVNCLFGKDAKSASANSFGESNIKQKHH